MFFRQESAVRNLNDGVFFEYFRVSLCKKCRKSVKIGLPALHFTSKISLISKGKVFTQIVFYHGKYSIDKSE